MAWKETGFWDALNETDYDLTLVGMPTKEVNRQLTTAPVTTKRILIDTMGSFDPGLLSRFQSLERFATAAWPASDFTALHGLRRLKRLWVSRIKNVERLDSLEPMGQLEVLALEGFMVALKRVKVASFDPLASLQKLKELSLWCVVPADNRIDALLKIPPLRHLGLIDEFITLDQLAMLEVHGHPVGELMSSEGLGKCFKCRKGRRTYLNSSPRGKKKFCCERCDAKRVEEHRAAYAEALAKAETTLKGSRRRRK